MPSAPTTTQQQFIEKYRFNDADDLRYFLPQLFIKTFLNLRSPDLGDWLCRSGARPSKLVVQNQKPLAFLRVQAHIRDQA